MQSRKEKERRDDEDPLRAKVRAIADKGGARNVAVAYHDYETETGWSYRGDEWFHAASTIKVPVLLGVFRAVEDRRITLLARVHVRNLFDSVVEDGGTFRVAASRDANSEVPRNIGKTMRVQELAHHMITTSSNLATNLLIDAVGVDATPTFLINGRRYVGGRTYAELRRVGFDKPAFDTIVASGRNAARPHARAGQRRIEPGDLVVLDFGGVRVYHSGDTEYDLRLRALAYDKAHPIDVCMLVINGAVLVGMGGAVLAIVLAILLPIFQLNSLIGK